MNFWRINLFCCFFKENNTDFYLICFPSGASSRSSRPVQRVLSQCYSRRVAGDDGAARRLANLAYQGSDGDLSPRIWSPDSGGGGEGGGGGSPPLPRVEGVLDAESGPLSNGAAAAAKTAALDEPHQQHLASNSWRRASTATSGPRLLFPPTVHSHIPSAISTPSRYSGLGIGGSGGGPLFRSQSARGRRRTATLSPTKTPPLSTVSSFSQVQC